MEDKQNEESIPYVDIYPSQIGEDHSDIVWMDVGNEKVPYLCVPKEQWDMIRNALENVETKEREPGVLEVWY